MAKKTRPIPVELPALYDRQARAVFGPARYAWIEASTKAGKTVACLVWQLSCALQTSGHHWWIAPVYAQARIAWSRAQRMMPRWGYTATQQPLEIKLRSGSTWEFRSGEQPDNLYGEDVCTLVIDEASRLREEAWHAARSTLTATRGPARLIGNVRGRRNWFWRACRRAESGDDPDGSYHRLTWRHAVAAGVLQVEEIEDARSRLPEHIFRELYEAEAASDDSHPIGIEAVDACVVSACSVRPAVCWGWDLARVRDWTVGVALDDRGCVVRLERWRESWQATVERIAAATGRLPAVVDATGVGDPVVERLQAAGMSVTPFLFTAASKQRVIEELAAAIRAGELHYPEGPIAEELRTLEWSYSASSRTVRYEAPSGLHDDCVCALALAWSGGRRYGAGRSAAPYDVHMESARRVW